MRKLVPILILIFAGLAYSTFSISDAQPTTTSFRLGYTIDLSINGALSIAIDTDSDNIYLGVARTGLVKLAPDGTVLDTYPISGVRVDNSGLNFDPLTGNFFFINGWRLNNPEPILKLSNTGEILSNDPSTVIEGTALGIDIPTGHLFALDANSSPEPLVKELALRNDRYIEINSFPLPNVIPANGDGGLAVNPSNGKLVVSGETLQSGILFEVSQDGTEVEEFLDIGNGNGVVGLAFDNDPFRLYILNGRGDAANILVYGEFEDGATVTPPPAPTSTPTVTPSPTLTPLPTSTGAPYTPTPTPASTATLPAPTPTPSGNCCSVWVALGIFCGNSRVSAAMETIDTIQTYTRFRDETLRRSDTGIQLIDIYNENTNELAGILVADADLRERTGQFLNNAADEFETLLPDSINSAVLTQELYDEANQLVTDLAAAGNPEFELQMQQLWSELALEQYIGQSTTEIWEQIQRREIYLPFITR